MISARWRTIWVAAVTAVALSTAGRLLTELSPWYYALKRPALQPPDWVFGPAWTLIYVCGTTAAVLAWRAAAGRSEKSRILWLFAVNGALNLMWSWLFFTLQRPDWALMQVGFLWLSIVALIVGHWTISRRASLLFVPYLLWVSFASYINYDVVRLNGPF